MESKLPILTFILAITFSIFSASSPLQAADQAPIITPKGVLSVRQGTTEECKKLVDYSKCEVLDLAGKALLADSIVSIDIVFPDEKNPQIIFAVKSTGGNACCAFFYLIDLTDSGRVLVNAIPTLVDRSEGVVKSFSKGITYQAYGEGEGPLGEPIWSVYRYVFGSGKIETLRSLPKYSYSPMEEKKYPRDLLDDPVKREPLVKLLGEAEFKSFRNNLQTAPPLEKLSTGLYAGEGCLAHSCGSSQGAFVIDVVNRRAWAIRFDPNNKRKFYGTISAKDDVIQQFFEKWFGRENLSWQKFGIIPPAKLVSPSISGRVEVPMVQEGGVLKVPLTLNDVIQLAFVVDSGAADVVIPDDVIQMMLKTGTLEITDFGKQRYYRLADGSIVQSKTFHIKSIKIGNRIIENVTASSTGVEGSLLLGQSFLSRLQRWSINNSNRTLELE